MQREAVAGEKDTSEAIATGEVGPNALPFVWSAGDRFRRIQASADQARAAIQPLREPEWSGWSVLRLSAWALVLSLIMFALWRTGLLAMIRGVVLSLVPAAVPQSTRAEASLAAQAMDPSREETIRELVAAKRATDPDFDRAFRQERERLLSSQSSSQSSRAESSPQSATNN